MKLILIIILISNICFADEVKTSDPPLKTEIYCSHIKVCQLIKDLAGDSVIIKESTNQKILKQAKLLVSTPFSLDPSVKKIVTYRENHNKETIRLFLPSNIIKLYKTKMTSPLKKLSSFWLYPNILCYMERGVISRMKKLGIKTRRNKCATYNKMGSQLSKILRKIRPIILTSKNEKIDALFIMNKVYFNKKIRGLKTINLDAHITNWHSKYLFGEFEKLLNTLKKLGKKYEKSSK
jgi:hypothetical protein